MIEGGSGAFWRTYGHNREVKVVNGVGRDRGGDRIFLPLVVRLANQNSSRDEPKTDNYKPKDLC